MSTLPANALVTRKEVKDFMNINASDNNLDNLINDLCGRISQAFQSFCGRDFISQAYTEYYDGEGKSVLFLDKYPITAIASINDDSDWTWGSSTLIPATSYRIQDERSVVFDVLLANKRQNIQILYTAGFESIPTDIKQACIEEVGRKVKHRNDFDEINKTLADGSVVYQDQSFLPMTKQILKSYRYIAVY